MIQHCGLARLETVGVQPMTLMIHGQGQVLGLSVNVPSLLILIVYNFPRVIFCWHLPYVHFQGY